MPAKKKHILVADDNLAMLGVIRFNLEAAGFQVTGVNCGPVAWKLLGEQDFDLVLVDFQMPEMTGGELSRRMRNDPRLARVPLILLTAKGFELDVDYFKSVLSVSDIIFKPFSPRELVRRVTECLALSPASP